MQTAWQLAMDPGVWRRGPAHLRGDLVVLDETRTQLYALWDPDLTARPRPQTGAVPRRDAYQDRDPVVRLLRALTDLHTPADVVSFVATYGLLTHGPGSRKTSESVTTILAEAEQVRSLVYAVNDLRKVAGTRKASASAVAQARDRLRTRWLDRFVPHHQQPLSHLTPREYQLVVGPLRDKKTADRRTRDDTVQVRELSLALAGILSQRLTPVRFTVCPQQDATGLVRPGRWLFGSRPTTLLDHVWAAVAHQVATSTVLNVCQDPHCQRLFQVTPTHHDYCTTACSGRARFRAWYGRQKQQARTTTSRQTPQTRKTQPRKTQVPHGDTTTQRRRHAGPGTTPSRSR